MTGDAKSLLTEVGATRDLLVLVHLGAVRAAASLAVAILLLEGVGAGGDVGHNLVLELLAALGAEILVFDGIGDGAEGGMHQRAAAIGEKPIEVTLGKMLGAGEQAVRILGGEFHSLSNIEYDTARRAAIIHFQAGDIATVDVDCVGEGFLGKAVL